MTERQALELLEGVLASTAELSGDVGASERSQAMHDEILSGVISPSGMAGDVSESPAYQNIEAVFGGAGTRAESARATRPSSPEG